MKKFLNGMTLVVSMLVCVITFVACVAFESNACAVIVIGIIGHTIATVLFKKYDDEHEKLKKNNEEEFDIDIKL